MFYGRLNTSCHIGRVVVECIISTMSLGLVKLMLSSIIVNGTVDEESFKEVILFMPFQVLFKSLIWF